MSTLKKLRFTISSYVDEQERRVGVFFGGLSEHSSRIEVRQKLMKLLQSNAAVINLWTEYRYKGYVYLKKSERKKLYQNLELIAADFERFRVSEEIGESRVREAIGQVVGSRPEMQRSTLLFQMMTYLSPQGSLYEYRMSSSFGRLLRDPATEKLVGDCNQIVTLYIYLYSRYFDVSDLKIRLLPEHVALHFQGVDIEATTGSFANYTEKEGASLQPIEEIVSVNLLDTTDEHFAKKEVNPKDFLQAARYASILSHNRDIVTKNLEAAYAKLVNSAMKRNDFRGALKMAQQSRDMQLISIVGNNGALYFMRQHNFAASRKFAGYALKQTELVRDSYQVEGVYHYDAGRYHDAIKAFERYGSKEFVAKCYEALFFEEQQKLGDSLTSESVKNHKSTIARMHSYAKKSGNKKLIEHVDGLKRYV